MQPANTSLPDSEVSAAQATLRQPAVVHALITAAASLERDPRGARAPARALLVRERILRWQRSQSFCFSSAGRALRSREELPRLRQLRQPPASPRKLTQGSLALQKLPLFRKWGCSQCHCCCSSCQRLFHRCPPCPAAELAAPGRLLAPRLDKSGQCSLSGTQLLVLLYVLKFSCARCVYSCSTEPITYGLGQWSARTANLSDDLLQSLLMLLLTLRGSGFQQSSVLGE